MNRMALVFFIAFSTSSIHSQSIPLNSKIDSNFSITSLVASDSTRRRDSLQYTKNIINQNIHSRQEKNAEPHFVTSIAAATTGVLLTTFGIQYWRHHTQYDDAAYANNISPLALGATATISIPVGCVLTYFGTFGFISDIASIFSNKK